MISLVEILALHDRIIERTGGALGVRDISGLGSAFARAFQTFEGKDLHPSPFDKAAALLHSICGNHPFVDGNKRTALVSAAYLLYSHGVELDIPTNEGETFMLDVAQGRLDVPAIAARLRAWSGERQVK